MIQSSKFTLKNWDLEIYFLNFIHSFHYSRNKRKGFTGFEVKCCMEPLFKMAQPKDAVCPVNTYLWFSWLFSFSLKEPMLMFLEYSRVTNTLTNYELYTFFLSFCSKFTQQKIHVVPKCCKISKLMTMFLCCHSKSSVLHFLNLLREHYLKSHLS